MSDVQLRWVHYNHGEPGRRPEPPVECGRTTRRRQWESTRPGAIVSAGSIAQKLLEKQAKVCAQDRRLLALLEQEAGSGLGEHVAGLRLTRGVLRIEVNEPALLYGLRLKWEQRLLAVLQEGAPELGIHTIRFVTARQEGAPRSKT